MEQDSYRDAAANPFYGSKAWKDCRMTYARKVNHLCERCLQRGIIKRGVIVHHIRPLNGDNIKDPMVTLAFSNLMLVCRRCHAEIHAKRRYQVDKDGHVAAVESPLV